MNDSEIDRILEQAARTRSTVDRALLDRVALSMQGSLRPVRPLAADWVLVGALFAVFAGIAAAAASTVGMYGVRALGTARIAIVFPVLAVLAWAAAKVSAAEMAPGSRRMAPPGRLLAIATAAMAAMFALLFQDYRMDGFVRQGLACLEMGMATAIPTGVLAWLILRRGFAVRRMAAGVAGGTLAGMAGVLMLELHCPNFRTMHVLVWHTAVIPVSALAGGIYAFATKRRAAEFMQ